MTSNLYQPYVYDPDKEYEFIGIGQIVDPKTYKLFCVPNKGDTKGEDAKGWGERYKVRLCFRNSNETKDEDLIDATRHMSFPSGHAGLQIYVPLAPNTFVNIHKNRLNRQYIISSVIGSSLCSFSDNKDPKQGCAPRSGFGAGIGGFTVPDTNTDGGKVVNENGAGADCTISAADKQQQDLNKYIFAPSACTPVDSNAINRDLINLKKDIEGLRNKINGPNSTLSNAEKFLSEAQQKVSSYADKITGWIKWLIDEIKLRVERGVNWTVNKAKAALYLNQRVPLQEKKTTALDLIACLFNKILDNLSSLIEQFLNQIIDRYVNMAVCAIEKFLTELVGQILGQILSAVNGILGAVLGTIAGIKGLVDSVLNAIVSLLDFLSCDVKAQCPDVKEWNFLEGGKPSSVALDVNAIFNSAKSIISSAKSIVDPNNFKFNLDINSMIVGVGDACNVGPILCGPPKISFWGGGGQGATGNAIVSATGDLLGIDIISPGFGYTKAPFVSIEDSCGRGKGATAVAVIGDVPYVPPVTGIGTTSTGFIGGSIPGTGKDGCDFSISEGYNGPGIYLDISDFPLDGRPLPFIVTMGDLENDDTNYSITIPNLISLDTQNVTSGLAEVDPLSRLSLQNLSVLFSKQIPGEYIKSKSGQKIFGPIKSTGGTLYIGNEKVEGISNSGTLSNKHIVIENGGDDWDDYVYELRFAGKPSGYYEFAKFVRLSDCFPSSPTGIGTTSLAPKFPKSGDIVKGVKKVFIKNNGNGYLPKPDGSKGGNERTWATRCQSIIRRADGNWEYPYNPGEIMNIKVGDYVQLAGESSFISSTERSVTAPPCPPEDSPIKGPITPDKPYKVVAELFDGEITNPGFGYTSGDTVVITPNNGAEFIPQFGYNGQLTGITVVRTGIGFTELPEIGIDSNTGHNAVIKPVFRILKGDGLITRLGAVDTIINVVDCVGKPG